MINHKNKQQKSNNVENIGGTLCVFVIEKAKDIYEREKRISYNE